MLTTFDVCKLSVLYLYLYVTVTLHTSTYLLPPGEYSGLHYNLLHSVLIETRI